MVQGTDEQFNEWKDDIEKLRVIGCFAMTEFGHSSYLRGLVKNKQISSFFFFNSKKIKKRKQLLLTI